MYTYVYYEIVNTILNIKGINPTFGLYYSTLYYLLLQCIVIRFVHNSLTMHAIIH